MKIFYILLATIFFLPKIGYGVTKLNESSDLSDVVQFVLGYFDQGIMLIMGLCVVTFIWGVYIYFFKNNDSAESRKEGGLFVTYAVIGFFVILSFWGLVAILKNTFGISSGSTVPKVQQSSSGGYSSVEYGNGTSIYESGDGYSSTEVGNGFSDTGYIDESYDPTQDVNGDLYNAAGEEENP